MGDFNVCQIDNIEDHYFRKFWEIYTVSFPLNERRIYEQQKLILDRPDYQLFVYIIENKIIGFIARWINPLFSFVEHFAIAPEFRNKKLGNTILKLFIQNSNLPIILEIEKPVDDLTLRRLKFYEKSGFCRNEHLHSQPPYHPGDEPLPMKILSYPSFIDSQLYQKFAQFQKAVMML